VGTSSWPWTDRVFTELELTESQAEGLREELVKNRHLRLRQTFTSYVIGSLPDDFWTIEIEDFHPEIRMEPDGTSSFTGMKAGDPVLISRLVPRDGDTLRRRLLVSYDARSSYVHDGSGRSSMQSTVTQLLASDPEPKTPIAFAALRAMLRSLLLTEMTARSTPTDLPEVQMINPSDGPTPATNEPG
jgi:hypothetical protein